MTILAGTGHRPDKLGGYSQRVDDQLVRVALRGIEKHQPTKVISGMALGWDMALAEAALQLSVPFLAAVPFAGQERLWPKATQDRYKRLLKAAAEVVVVCEGGYAAWKLQTRNIWMVDHCGILLALWNGTAGGTKNCLDYAKKVERIVDNVWPLWEQLAA